jgi:acyl-CoA thioester hydrolase
LSIRSFVKSITKTSFFMNQFITRGENLIAEAKIHLVFVNKEGRPMRIPDSLFEDFKPYFCDTIKL